MREKDRERGKQKAKKSSSGVKVSLNTIAFPVSKANTTVQVCLRMSHTMSATKSMACAIRTSMKLFATIAVLGITMTATSPLQWEEILAVGIGYARSTVLSTLPSFPSVPPHCPPVLRSLFALSSLSH